MSKCNESIKKFTEAKLAQFKSVINDPDFGGDILGALKAANYRIEMVGKTTHCTKGRAIVSFDGRTSEARITLLRPC